VFKPPDVTRAKRLLHRARSKKLRGFNLKSLTSTQIVRLLEEPGKETKYRTKQRIKRAAAPTEIIQALDESSNPTTVQILCDLLGELRAGEAVPKLVACLAHPAKGVRSSAADALAKVGAEEAGATLLARFSGAEREISVVRMLAAALGAVGYLPAIPQLVEALKSPDASLRGSAAWSLGALEAREAEESLRLALGTEENSYARARMKEAIETISSASAKV
jgi:HEAT repeat protein